MFLINVSVVGISLDPGEMAPLNVISSGTIIIEPRHEISNKYDILTVQTPTSLCSLLLSLETPNGVQSVA